MRKFFSFRRSCSLINSPAKEMLENKNRDGSTWNQSPYAFRKSSDEKSLMQKYELRHMHLLAPKLDFI